MAIIFPTYGADKKDDSSLATVVVDVLPNGVLGLSESSDMDGFLQTSTRHDEEMLDVDSEQEITDRKGKMLERALEISEDVGILVEFILSRLGKVVDADRTN